jgi:hypothetical protein
VRPRGAHALDCKSGLCDRSSKRKKASRGSTEVFSQPISADAIAFEARGPFLRAMWKLNRKY